MTPIGLKTWSHQPELSICNNLCTQGTLYDNRQWIMLCLYLEAGHRCSGTVIVDMKFSNNSLPTFILHITHNFYTFVYDRIKSRVVLYHLRVCRFVNVLRNNRELTALSSLDSMPRWSKLVRQIRRLVRWWRDDTACTKCPLLPAMIWLTGSRVSSEYLMFVIGLWCVYR